MTVTVGIGDVEMSDRRSELANGRIDGDCHMVELEVACVCEYNGDWSVRSTPECLL